MLSSFRAQNVGGGRRARAWRSRDQTSSVARSSPVASMLIKPSGFNAGGDRQELSSPSIPREALRPQERRDQRWALPGRGSPGTGPRATASGVDRMTTASPDHLARRRPVRGLHARAVRVRSGRAAWPPRTLISPRLRKDQATKDGTRGWWGASVRKCPRAPLPVSPPVASRSTALAQRPDVHAVFLW